MMQETAHPLTTTKVFERASWDDLRYLLAVLKAGSFRKAASELGCAPNTIRMHMDRLEDVAGTKLLERTPIGISATIAGEKLRQTALEMQAASQTVGRHLTPSLETFPETVKITCTEGLGTFWLIPRIAEFRKQYPDIALLLECSMSQASEFPFETGLTISLERPTDEALVAIRLGCLHLMPFAANSYLRAKGTPQKLSDLRVHSLVVQQADQVRSELFSIFVGDDRSSQAIKLTTNNSAAHYLAIAEGIGIGVLPTYARAITTSVTPIDINLQFRREIWLSFYPEAKKIKAVRKAIEWLKGAFNEARFPWFSDDFVHPKEFEQRFEGDNVIRLFAQLMDNRT